MMKSKASVRTRSTRHSILAVKAYNIVFGAALGRDERTRGNQILTFLGVAPDQNLQVNFVPNTTEDASRNALGRNCV